MATERRVARVAELIKREVSQLLMYEIRDERVGAGMVSVTDVEVSGDLQHAKNFSSASTAPMRCGAQQWQVSRLPQALYDANSDSAFAYGGHLRWCLLKDRSLERGSRILSLLNQIGQQQSTSEAPES